MLSDETMKEKYINLFTDFGFKKIFGEEGSKEQLIAFLDTIPAKLQQAVFIKIFDKAQIAKFDPVERQAYEDSLKYYRDMKNVIDTAAMEAEAKGMEKGIELGKQEGEQAKALEIARNLLDVLDDAIIAVKTGLSVDEVQALR
jgi:predicted transposase/invertase (TIGR01784 family)